MASQELNELLKTYPIAEQVKKRLLGQVWNSPLRQPKLGQQPDAQPYFEFYWIRCQQFLLNGGRYVLVKTHSDVVEIATMILDGIKRDEIQGTVLKQDPTVDPKIVDTSIDLCASLMLMVEVGEHNFGLSGCDRIDWKSGSIRECMAAYITPQKVLVPGNLRLGKAFTTRSLSRISGIKIKWTTNLVDHLLLTDDDQAVFMFHCASFLKIHESTSHEIFPKGFIKETLLTLALLFPQNDTNTRSWIQSQIETTKLPLDPEVGRCGSLRTQERRFEEFSFWHDRLVILKQVFDESRPRTLTQWWLDRRNGEKWYTFWIAVLVFVITVVFGVVQSVEGALQVYLSYKSLQNTSS